MADPLSVASATASGNFLPALTLVLGGARSGKSAYAERLIEGALAPGASGLYLATAAAGDAEMAARIAEHRARRGPSWRLREEPLELAGALVSESRRPILVDCLTLWLSNLMAAGRDAAAESGRLVAVLARLEGPVVFVSNEVGLGIVPDNAPARAFRDHAGRLHQAVGAAAQRVVFMAAGLPLVVKDG
ncbi:MAG: bifunctional adenosylcobinamide kinase/adenosylcobinamide-phosphate guanylyltransferase [Pseudomonadota bacterium]